MDSLTTPVASTSDLGFSILFLSVGYLLATNLSWYYNLLHTTNSQGAGLSVRCDLSSDDRWRAAWLHRRAAENGDPGLNPRLSPKPELPDSHYETWLFPCLHKTYRCPPAPGPLPAALCLSGSPLTQPAVLFHCACVRSSPQPKLRPETIFFENFKITFTMLVYVQFPFCCLSVHKPGVCVVRYINVY